MRKAFVSGLMTLFTFGVCAESVTNNLNVQGGFIYNHGMINPGDIGMSFTNEGIRDVTISAGQLSGVNPETGEVITNAFNLLPLRVQSVEAGLFSGDGSGLINLDAGSFSGTINVASLPTSGVWNAANVTITDAGLAGHITVSSLTVTTNLTVQGTISGDGSGLTGVTAGAGGEDRTIQFNNNGALAGNTNFFMHPTENRPAFRSPSGNFFRGYNSETLSDNNLIYSLRNEAGTSVLRLRENGQDTIRLSGDGSAYIKGNLQLDGQLIADGSGLTNLPVQAQLNTLVAAISNSPAASITTNQIASWNSGGVLASGVQVLSESVSIATNLTVQGTIQAEGISAAGSEGSFQVKQNGKLAGTDKLFIHEETGKPAFYSENGNLFRAYKSGVVAETNLIYSLRTEKGEAVLRMFKNGVETVKIKGDGTLELAGQLTADASGLTNLASQPELAALITAVSGSPAAAITTNQIATLERIQLSGSTVTVTTNLTVQGAITGDGSGLSQVAAGGAHGTFQFNDNGILSGNTNFFIHPTEKKPAFRSPSGYFFRGYNSETISDSNLIYSLRNESGTSVLRLRQNGQDKLVLKGDGSITFGGETRTAWPEGTHLTNTVTTTFTYVPPQGDLAMGIYTNGVH